MTPRDLWLRLRALIRPGRVERDLHDELAAHVEFEIDKLVRSGVPAEDARRVALVRFGSVAATAEECRDARGVRVVTQTMADLRFALRQFRRRPWVTVAMVVVLAVGLGFATATFVFISSLTVAPLAGVDAGDGAVRIRGIDRSRGPGQAVGREFTYAEALEFSAHRDLFDEVGAWTSTDVVIDVGLGGGGAPNLQSGAATFVTAAYFRALGVQPVRGSGLPPSFDDMAEPHTVGVISDAIWDRFYDRSGDVIGRTLKVNDTVVTIAGVAPRRFIGARAGGSAIRVWLPLNTRPVVQPSAPLLRSDAAVFGLVARLTPGVTLDHATTVVATVATRFGSPRDGVEGRPRSYAADVVPVLATNYFPPSGDPSSGAGRALSLAMPLLVLLITCTSVSALLAGQALARRREIAVRIALGAHRGRIVRQLLTETAVLGVGAGALAMCVLWWMLAGADVALFGSGALFVIDWRAMVFAAALAIVASVGFGLSPALHATRATVGKVLKEGDTARGRTRLQATLVIAQIALTQPALLMVGTAFIELRRELREQAPEAVAADRLVEIGFNTNPRYGDINEQREDAIGRVRARIAALPGVAGAVPQFSGERGHEPVASHPDDLAGGQPGVLTDAVFVQPAPDGYFEVMGLALAEGRAFGAGDRASRDVAIINRELAVRLWGEASAIGRRVRIGVDDSRGSGMVTVVGVIEQEGTPALYRPLIRGVTSHLLIRTHELADAVLPAIRATALNEAPEAPITTARTLASIEADARRFTMRIVYAVGAGGAVALLLAAVGLYAVVAVAVGQRRHEIAVHAALGANGRAITTLFVKRGLGICVTGAAIGLVMSFLAMRLRSEVQMFGEPSESGVDGGVAAGVTLFVMGVALVACWIPARRAAAIDPASVLRAE